MKRSYVRNANGVIGCPREGRTDEVVGSLRRPVTLSAITRIAESLSQSPCTASVKRASLTRALTPL